MKPFLGQKEKESSPCRVFWISAADGEAAVLLLDEVLPVAVLDAHPGRLAQLQVEAVRG